VDEVDTWEVAEGLQELAWLVEDDEWSTALAVTTVSHLTLASTNLVGGLGVLDICIGAKLTEQLGGILGLFEISEGRVVNDEWDLWNTVDSVTTSEDDRR